MPLALRLALRDWRGGTGPLRGMGIVLLCLALGVAAIGAIGGLRDAIQDGVAAQRRAILGGDLSIESTEPLPAALSGFLRHRGARTSDLLRLRTMLYADRPAAADTGDRMLVDLSAIDAAYPLVGVATVSGGAPLFAALSPRDGVPGIALDPLVVARLSLRPGDIVRLGTARFRVLPVLDRVPDAAGHTALAPPAVIRRDALAATGLLAPGALLTDAVRTVLSPGAPDETAADRLHRTRALAGALSTSFPGSGWRVRDIDDAAPALTRAVDQVAQFMTLIALAALLLGGIGVAAGVSSWLDRRIRTIAVLRALGAPPRLAAAVVSLQVGALCLLGVAFGTGLGLLVPPLAVRELGGLLPVAPSAGVHWRSVILASGFGLLVAVLFGLSPLLRAVLVPPSVLFRGPAAGTVPIPPSRRLAVRAAQGVLLAGLVALAVFTAPDRRLALGFCGVSAVVLLGFELLGRVLVRLVRIRSARSRPAPPSRPAPAGLRFLAIRLGLRALGRPGAPAGRLLLALGAGLTVLSTVALVEGNLRRSLTAELPRDAPSFFFIDIQPDQLDRFRRLAAAQPGVGAIRSLPSLRTRVVAVDGVPAERVRATPGTAWALRGDHGLTIAAEPPADTDLAAGAWWPPGYDGAPLLSLDAGLARGWNARLGSVVTLNVLGRNIDLRVASLRNVAWRSLQLNFAFVASPGLLSAAPHTEIATVSTDKDGRTDARLLAAVTDALPNVSGIRVTDLLEQISAIVGKLALALAAIGAVALLSGALVLAATLAAGEKQRTAEAAVLRTLGATAPLLRLGWLAEFAVLGALSGILAIAVGSLLSWLLMRFVMRAPWHPLPGTSGGVVAGAIALMLLAGFLATRRALRARPALLLRDT
ncbi:MAG: ABC transporter permease [Gluconacetobacter diazotrophicus]|nr:ABC transporter permease [Gluconacetobacter diazotrophicus]